jgi:hypothetical protein
MISSVAALVGSTGVIFFLPIVMMRTIEIVLYAAGHA